MKTSQENKEDLLKEYINPEGIERAPEGFTNKLMSRLQLESPVMEPIGKTGRLKLVPVISVAVTLVFVAVAIFLPDKSSATATGPVADFINNISLHIRSIGISSHMKLNIPATFIYISVAVFMLSFFDRALDGLFHRDK